MSDLRPRNITTPKAEKRMDEAKGYHGLYAREPISRGELVWISFLRPEDCEFFPWSHIQKNRHLVKYAYQIDTDVFSHSKDVDSDISNFLNHACDPNCWYDYSQATRDQARGLYKNGFLNDADIEFIVAKKDISLDEELTMDYSTFWTVADLEFECFCGSPICRRQVRKDDYKRMDPAHVAIHVGAALSRR